MYFGSVRFFKNLILVAVIILILVPTVLAIVFGVSLNAQKAEIEVLRVRLDTMEETLPVEPVFPEQPMVEQPPEDFSPDLPEYQYLYPDFYAPTAYHATERTEGMVYLTFDDGPSSSTPTILKILEEEDVKATFFVTGRSDETSLQRMRDIVAAGHTIGMHSYTHEYSSIYNSVEDFLGDMYQIFYQIRETTGVTPTVFRFPGGTINGYNAGLYQELVAEMMRRGFVPYDWNLSAEDSVQVSPSADQIVHGIVDSARDREVKRGFVLMHDSAHAATTVQALPRVIQGLRDQGYQFDRITPDTKPVLFVYKD